MNDKRIPWNIDASTLTMPATFLVAGIVNVTPDSFSDGGKFFERDRARELILKHVEEGANCLDLGAESTRPNSVAIDTKEEIRRLNLVLDVAMSARDDNNELSVSIDTFHSDTAASMLERGVDIINDISGAFLDSNMASVVAEYKPGFVLGHCPVLPAIMHEHTKYTNVVDSVIAYFNKQMDLLVKKGLPEGHICLDPCIGFAKTTNDSLKIINSISKLLELGRPLYFGISRKRFIGEITEDSVENRLLGTQVVTAFLASKGVFIHRVHDVLATRKTLNLISSMMLGEVCNFDKGDR